MAKKLRQLDFMCDVGERVKWSNVKGEDFEGMILVWNSTMATIRLDDGTQMTVKC